MSSFRPAARRWIHRLVACVTLITSPTARAHPFGDRYAAQRLDVGVTRERVTVTLVADLPSALLQALGQTPQEALSALPHGLLLTVDGRSVPLEVGEQRLRTDLLDPGTWLLELRAVAAVTLDGPARVEVSNGNLSGLPGWYWDEVTLEPGVTVVSSSLLTVLRDGVVQDLTGAWSRSELRRRVQVDLDASDSLWRRLYGRVDPTPVPLARALEIPTWRAWRHGQLRPETAGVALGCAGVAGLAAGLASRTPRGAAASGVLGAGVGAALTAALIGPAWALPGAVAWALGAAAGAPLRHRPATSAAIALAVAAAALARWTGSGA